MVSRTYTYILQAINTTYKLFSMLLSVALYGSPSESMIGILFYSFPSYTCDNNYETNRI